MYGEGDRKLSEEIKKSCEVSVDGSVLKVEDSDKTTYYKLKEKWFISDTNLTEITREEYDRIMENM